MFEFIRKKMQEAFDAGRHAERDFIMSKISGAASKNTITPALTSRRKSPRRSGVTHTLLRLIGETEDGITSSIFLPRRGSITEVFMGFFRS
jgi:hypothetical protein